MSRISYSIKNAKVVLLFHLLLLVLNFFSRQVFISVLGTDVVGLTSAIQGYIGMLNLADLGISAAIAAVLYAPLFKSDRQQITEVISIYGYLFRWVGIIIAVAGVILSLFLPLLFAKEGIDLRLVYFSFYTFLTVAVLSYVVNYKQNLLIANQKSYIVVTILNLMTILKIIVQIALLKWFSFGYIAWLSIELVSALCFALFLEWRINKEYPWLRSRIREGRKLLKKYPEITRNIKQVFSHKIAGYVQHQSSPVIVQLLMGVSMVTHYTNYIMISGRLTQLVVGTFTSNTAGVGNLIAEGNKGKIKLVFWQMNAMFFWIGAVVAFGFCMFITPLVKLWIPSAQTFSELIVLLMGFNLFVYIVRQPVIYFINGYGIFSDTWAAWVEASVNLTLSIILTIKFGIIGVVAGTAIATFFIVILWRPHYLYRRGFGENSGTEYWLTILKYLLLISLTWVIVIKLDQLMFPTEASGWIKLFVNGVATASIFAALLGLLFWLTSRGMRDFVRLGINLISNRK